MAKQQPNDVLTISKGKDKQKVTRKAFDTIYSDRGYKIEHDPVPVDGEVIDDGDPVE